MNNVPNFWTDKTVMITGASSGIGRGLALAIAARGARLGLLARRQSLLDEIVVRVKSRAVSVVADVRDANAMKLAADQVREELGPIDILIANAGIGTADHISKLDPHHAADDVQEPHQAELDARR